MSLKKLVLVYHADNQEVANLIERQFSSYGYTFKHVTNGKKSVKNQLNDVDLPTILLVSDNFLKSTSSMESAMEWTQKMLQSNLLLPVVVDGKEKNEETGKTETHSTIFQRVSDVIKYMNYWQEQYLALRKQRRTAPIEQEPELSAKLQIVKSISAETGEYLRFLKNQNPISFIDFTQNGYAAFFKFTNDEAGHLAYKTKHRISEVASTPQKNTAISTKTSPPSSVSSKEIKSINEKFSTPNRIEKDSEVPVFEPAKVSQETAKEREELKTKVAKERKDDIPIFVPAVVPERSQHEVKTTAKKSETTEDNISVFEPTIAKKRGKTATDKEEDIPVFVPAAVPNHLKNKVEPTEKEEQEENFQEKSTSDLVDIIQSSSRQLLAENEKEEDNKDKISEEMPPIDLDTLPGMELLTEKGQKTEIKPQDLEDDFIKSIEAYDDFDEDDMEFEDDNDLKFEDEQVGNLEDLATQIEKEEANNGVSMDKLNQIVDEVIEEEARATNASSETDDDEMSDLMNILEENQAQEEQVIAEIFQSKNKAEAKEETTEPEVSGKDMNDIFSEMEKSYSPESLDLDISDFQDDELARLISEVEKKEETVALAEDDDSASDTEIETTVANSAIQQTPKEQKISADLSDIFEERAEDEDTDYVESDAQISRAYQYFETANWDGGLAVLQDGLTAKPEDSDLRFQYALALAKHKGDFKEATRQLEILLGFNQQHEEAFFLLGEIAELHQDFLTARNYYEKVAAINDDFPEIYYRLGIISNLHFDDQKEAAAGYFKQAIKKNKYHADAHYRLGILLHEYFGNHLKAVKNFKKVLAIQPEHPFANYDLAVLYHRLNDRALANIYYQKAVDTNAELQTPENNAAFKYELIDRPEKGISAVHNDNSKEAVLLKDMARLEKKMSNLAKENIATQQIVTRDLEEEEIDELENLFAEEIQEAPVANIPDIPKPSAKTILITGATSGIGRATAELFAENGYRIIMTGRREERLNALKEDFENRFNSDILTLPFDVRNVEEVQSAIDSITSEWREIDILLNNAGLAKGTSPIHEGDLQHWEQMIDTNIKGLLYMTRAIAPQMVANREGHIINIASSAGKEVYPGGNVYCATKHAVDALTRAMRIDLHAHNVRVSQVAPGMVEETEFSLVRYDGNTEKAKIYDDFNPLTARDVAEVIYFVATRPKHVNIQDVLLFGTQQANSIYTNRDGRETKRMK